MNKLDIIVLDFETGGINPDFHEAIQVAGKAYNARTLDPYPPEEGGEFCSLMRPLYPERLEDEALAVNGKTREELAEAPEQKVVWRQFVEWVSRWNRTKTEFGAPIAAGKNIRSFDLRFARNLNALHCPKKEKTVLFNVRQQLDLEDIIFLWFENEQEPKRTSMDALREFFGMSTENAHDALQDCRQTGDLIMKFLRLHRELQRRTAKDGTKLIKFKGAFGRVA